MAYITKAKDGLVQLWNNKPIYNNKHDIWYAWIVEGKETEVGIDYWKRYFKKSCNF